MSIDVTFKDGWYLLKTKPREEFRAKAHLEAQHFKTYCPEVLEKSSTVPLFPGYVFIHLCTKDLPSYHKIRNTPGTARMVHFKSINRKLYSSGKLTKEEADYFLPDPIPNGDKLIKQIEAYTLEHNAAITSAKNSESFKEGEPVLLKKPLFEDLETTFIKGINVDRGLILIEYIKKMQTDDGVQEKVVGRQKFEVALKDLKKVPEKN